MRQDLVAHQLELAAAGTAVIVRFVADLAGRQLLGAPPQFLLCVPVHLHEANHQYAQLPAASSRALTP
jgi:hypothetical protein